MKKISLVIMSGVLFLTACSNSNTVNVPKDDSAVGAAQTVPHDSASDMRDSARRDTSVQHRY